jgi:enoyl-CoA hydratase
MADSAYIQFERTGRIGVVTLSGPKEMTVIGTGMLRALGAVFREVSSDPAVKVIILTGKGKVFAAGADIKEMKTMAPDASREFARLGNEVFDMIEAHPVPVIAAVNGAALGGGLELVLSVDFAYASSLARFALPEVTLGLIPGFGGCRRLAERIGAAWTKELACTGRVIEADEALRLGIVNKVTEPDALMPAALAAAGEIVAASGNAVRGVKDLICACAGRAAGAATALEIEKFGSIFTHPDAAAGIDAFISKTTATWEEHS